MTRPTCSGRTKSGKPCSRLVRVEGAFCYQHLDQDLCSHTVEQDSPDEFGKRAWTAVRSAVRAFGAARGWFRRLSDAWLAVIVSLAFILVVGLITWIFRSRAWNWDWYGVVIGILVGLLAGFLVLSRVPRAAQIAAVGVFGGMGIDLATVTAIDSTQAATALTHLADFVGALIEGATGILESNGGSPDILNRPLTIGLWVFIGTLGVVMLFSLVLDAARGQHRPAEPEGPDLVAGLSGL